MRQAQNEKKEELIWIIGYMGSGKSTVGRLLAERLGAAFTDSDEWIVHSSGKTVATLFELEGEISFRAREQQCAEAIISARREKHIVACGGGTPCHNDLIDRMLSSGTVIYLAASVSTLTQRLSEAPAGRPLLKGVDTDRLGKDIQERLKTRVPVYNQAHITVVTDGKTPETVVAEIVRLVS
jgi:shikimate kinase